MKTRYWVIILVIVSVVVAGIVFFTCDYFPRPFFPGGKHKVVNQYEIFIDLLVIKGKEGQLQIALEQSKHALERSEVLDEKKFGKTICLAKNALAYHLCMEGCPDVAERAICLAKYVYDRRWDYDYTTLACKFVETYVFVLIKMGDDDQKKKGVKILKAALKRREFPVDLKEYIERKYKEHL